ncbi:MAG: very short patch repair endonuclease [Alkalilacustris sp.]
MKPAKRPPMTRSEVMASVRHKDTRPEMVVRRGLHAIGLRFRLHRKDLPGRPDLVFPRYRAAVFVHGCFWHAHQGCPGFRLPKSRQEFWQPKLLGNRMRDERDRAALLDAGWRVLIVWECAIRQRDVLPEIVAWLAGGESQGEISGPHGSS